MAPERVHDVPFVDDDDDDMPPLVDNPYPSMTFTFAANMTPITYSTDPSGLEMASETIVPSAYTISPDVYPVAGETRTSHSKKKDSTHIPRPPNAFILFRSSFIKAQHIPEKIEGNHSALSKIIGKYWKALPREEREVWEAKAIVALAEHRKKYPDWRFRPGANALSKVKDGPRRRSNKKGRGEAEKEVRNRSKRCDKIADLLVAGKTGTALEAAVEQYDCETGAGPKVDEEDGCGVLIMKIENPADLCHSDNLRGERTVTRMPVPACNSSADDMKLPPRRGETGHIMQIPENDARFKTPLTSMFKRSSSAPATISRNSLTDSPSPSPQVLGRRESFSAAPSSGFSGTLFASSGAVNGGSDARVDHDASVTANEATTRGDEVDNLSPLLSPSLSSVSSNLEPDSHDTGSQWIETYMQHEANRYTPTLPAFVPDVDSPAPSPPAFPLDSDGEHAAMTAVDDGPPTISFGGAVHAAQPYSSYSSLDGWAGGEPYSSKGVSGGYGPLFSPVVVTPLSPLEYDYDSIMKDAFEAASYAQLEGFEGNFSSAHVSCRWDIIPDVPSAVASIHPAQWY